MAQFPVPMGRAEQDTKAEQIRELVSKYCRLDYEGARLGPQGWPKASAPGLVEDKSRLYAR